MDRKQELLSIFADIDAGQLRLIERLIDETVFLEQRMTELRRLPMIEVHPRHPELQRSTAAARQYKECAAQYMNAVRILCRVLARTEPTAADELMKQLEGFL